MKLTFLGATKTVTGSKYLIEDDGRKVLVDCGLFQGRKELRLRNWEKLPVNPSSIDAVILTHAHLDHSGYIPLLVKQGFRGKIYCTAGTADLCGILLPDSGYIQEEDAARANRYSYSKHTPALPLYTREDAEASLEFINPVPFGKRQMLGDETSFTFHRAGHILGAAMVQYRTGDGTTVLFSGDLGRRFDPLMKPPATIHDADYVVMESTYGDRVHGSADPAIQLGQVMRDTVSRGGTVLIPAFAVGRAQLLMYYIYRMKAEGALPQNVPVFLDSPMAINATNLLRLHQSDHRLNEELCAQVCDVATYVHTAEESRALNSNPMPKIIISASGMATGGRVLHHLKHYLGDPRNTILLAGFQAAETRGDRLARGEKEIKIHGAMWPVKAQVVQLDSMSAHADADDLMAWLGGFRTPPRGVFITHGEETPAIALRDKINAMEGWEAVVPDYLDTIEI